VDYYEFNVGPGVQDITANVTLANDAERPGGRLPDQPGRRHVLGYGQNSLNGTRGLSLTAYTLNPVPAPGR
jgi:hypothetical protein